MELTRTQGAIYVGAGIGTAVGFTALRHGGSPKALALGAATGLLTGGVQSFVQARTGSSELGWAAAAGGGAIGGALLLGGLGAAGMSPLKARGIGAAIGVATGVFAPIVGGIVLAQIEKAAS